MASVVDVNTFLHLLGRLANRWHIGFWAMGTTHHHQQPNYHRQRPARAGVWTTTLSASSVTLAAGETADISVWAEIPGNAAGGDDDTATVTATSQGDGSVSDSADLTTTAVGTAVYGVTLSADDAITDTAGTTVTYTVYLTNTDSDAATVTATLLRTMLLPPILLH